MKWFGWACDDWTPTKCRALPQHSQKCPNRDQWSGRAMNKSDQILCTGIIKG